MKDIYVALYDIKKQKSIIIQGEYIISDEKMELYYLRPLGDAPEIKNILVTSVYDYEKIIVRQYGIFKGALAYITESKEEALGKLPYLELFYKKVLSN